MASGEMTLREVLLAESYQMEIADLRSQLADAQAYATNAIAQRDKAEAENAKLRKVVEAARRLTKLGWVLGIKGLYVALAELERKVE